MKESTKNNWDVFWEEKSNLGEVYPNTDRIRRHLGALIDLRGKRILEVGAGTGRDSFYMSKDGAELHLLDYSMNSLKLIKKAAPADFPLNAIGGDAFALPFNDGTFDVVFHQGLLEHFRKEKADALLAENIRVLNKGGLLIVDVPQRWHVYTIVKHILIAANAWFAGWEREFSVRELTNLLESKGMRRRASYGEWMYPSFFYRSFREAGRKIGLKLPLYPTVIPGAKAVRAKLRQRLEGSALHLNTSLSIGVIAEKL